MRRGTSTQWYIGGWVTWVAAMFAFSYAYRHVATLGYPWWQDPNLTAIATVAEMSMLVMFVAWVGALVRLARLQQWNWFVAVLVTQLLWAGIAGMVCYAGSGPEKEDLGVSRPQVT
ncbi:MAG TPA: hypothetical protein VNA65_01455 [Candidatus Dormibacteraeota bacterium]|nr:hypothetical protein [Candidatus Dormibacteraeota bacterium]